MLEVIFIKKKIDLYWEALQLNYIIKDLDLI